MEKAVTYKANFESMVACALGGSLYRRGSCCTFLKQNIMQRTFGGLELWVKKMGPNSELRSSSLKIRRKHFLSTIFRHLRIHLGKNRIEQSTSIINLFAKVLQAYSYLHNSNEPHQAYNGFTRL
ncbi:uncharacterized protein [Pyrus communis]|uniref:uncharacterized protein isoform X1 n=1 Tax=Pyrus communis TaxID=23211 RepID=UPI0035BFE78A